MAIVIDGKVKRYMVDASQMFKLGERMVGDDQKYLGVQFRPRGVASLQGAILEDGLNVLKRDLLKPQQKLFFLKENLMPKLQHRLVLGVAKMGTLRKLDIEVCHHVRLWLRLLKDTPVAYLHARTCADGLGLPQYETTNPILQEKPL